MSVREFYFAGLLFNGSKILELDNELEQLGSVIEQLDMIHEHEEQIKLVLCVLLLVSYVLMLVHCVQLLVSYVLMLVHCVLLLDLLHDIGWVKT